MNFRFLLPRSSARRFRTAWTLLEMTVTVGISSVVMAAVMQTSLFTSRSFVALGNYNDLDRASRNTLDQMTRDVRQAKVFSQSYYSTNFMYFTNQDNSYFGYVWNPQTKVVSRLTGLYDAAHNSFYNTQSSVMLTGCDYFSFRIWLRNPTNGFLFPYSADTSVVDTKLVDVSWRCNRSILNQLNTESVQTAKIVLRN
jgi:type II secretory pathway pseudopilin PulG